MVKSKYTYTVKLVWVQQRAPDNDKNVSHLWKSSNGHN
jgi:hypothetical protein